MNKKNNTQSKTQVEQTDLPELITGLGEQPAWLKSSYLSKRWIVTNVGDQPDELIRFDIRFANGESIDDYPHLLDTVRRIGFGIRTGPLARTNSGAQQSSAVANLMTLVRWMIANHITRFSDIRSIDIEDYTALAAHGIAAIVDAKAILEQHLTELVTQAGFDEEDTADVRLQKAIAVFPHRFANDKKKLTMDRLAILQEVGLDTIMSSNRGLELALMMDAIEKQCGFEPHLARRTQTRALKQTDETDDPNITIDSIRRLLMSFQLLYEHRRYLRDAIQFPPFPTTGPIAVAQTLGRKPERTPTIPITQGAAIIERSIRWVLDYAPMILEVRDQRDKLNEFSTKRASTKQIASVFCREWPMGLPGSPFPLIPNFQPGGSDEPIDEVLDAVALRGGVPLHTAICYLMTACAIVIAAFSARRAAEILGLKEGCIQRDDDGNHWLNIFIHKTLMVEDQIPVPNVVANAVAVLEQISAKARRSTNTPYLFQYHVPGLGKTLGLDSDGFPVFRLTLYFRRFGYFLDVPELPDGTRWGFRPHQFRRFFAILYIWVYELGDWGALSHHLRHRDLEMTRRYASDIELGHILAVANKGRTANLLVNATLGKLSIAGEEGTRLAGVAKRLYERMSNRINIVTEEQFAKRIERFVDKANIDLQGLPWGYCAAQRGAARGEFVCSPLTDDPKIENATVSTCVNCAFNIRTGTFLPYLRNTYEQHRKIADSESTSPMLRRASETFCNDLTNYINPIADSTKK